MVLSGTGRCPTNEAVQEQLRRLGPGPRPRRAHIEDLGAAFRVEVGAARKTYPDPARRCEERSRTAALYLFLAREPAPPPPRPLHLDVELGGLLSFAPEGLLSGGGGARLTLGRGPIGGSVGAQVVAPVALTLGEAVPVALWRFPLDLSARVTVSGGALRGVLEGVFDAGVLLCLGLAAHDQPVTAAEQPLGLAPGLRLAAQLRGFASRRLALGLGAALEWTPRPLRISTTASAAGAPAVAVEAPGLWLSGTLAVLWRLR